MVHGVLRCHRTCEMWRIGGKLARHILKAFHFLRIVGIYFILDVVAVNEVSIKTLTWYKVPCIHQARADGHKQNPFILVQRIVLGHDNIDSPFTDGVRSRRCEFKLIDEISICYASRQSEDFLLVTFA